MSPAPAVALGAVAQARTLLALAQAMGWVRTSTDKSLERIETRVRLLLEAPLHEGLDRIEHAAKLDDPDRQGELIKEGQSKLHDAAARQGMPPRVVAIACMTCASLARIQTDTKEAQIWVSRALDAFDNCLLEAHLDASREALMDLGVKDRPSRQGWPRRTWSRVRRGTGILRACMRESSESVQALTARLEELNAEVAEAHAMAAELEVPVDGRCCAVSVRTFRAVVVLVKLARIHPVPAPQ
jgi:hypothetical protein